MFESIKTLDDLKSAILTINEKDYGDFKRKVVLYINRFTEEHKLSAADQKIFAVMVDKIQFQPPTDIERTRSWSLGQLENIKH